MVFCPCFSWEYVLFGALGGLVAILIQPGAYFEFPCIRCEGTRKRLYFGTVKLLIVSAVAGCLGDKHPSNAFMWGLAGWHILRWLADKVEHRIEAVLGKGEK